MKYFFKLITRHIIVIWIVVLIYNIFANTLFWREYEIVPYTYKDVTVDYKDLDKLYTEENLAHY